MQRGCDQCIQRLHGEPLPSYFLQLDSPHMMLAAPRHIFNMAHSLSIIYNEMSMPEGDRAAAEVIAEPRSKGRRLSQKEASTELCPRGKILVKLVQRCQQSGAISVSDVHRPALSA